MLAKSLLTLATVLPALASWIPSPGEIFEEAYDLVHGYDNSGVITKQHTFVDGKKRLECTLKSLGEGEDDTENFIKIVKKCGRGGIINFPDPVYTLSRPFEIELHDATLNVHGFLTHTGTVDEWLKNRIVWPFQNHSLGLIISGSNFVLDGHNTGGIDGNGQTWYDYGKDVGNKFGRPMTMSIKDAKDVEIRQFTIKQPGFWASLLIDTENVLMRDIYINATSYNPESFPDNKSWLQNTDGIDTYKSHNVTIENFVYQGGDDCIALKPNSTSITIRNVTCFGGTGIALGSIAQYEGRYDVIEDVLMEDIGLYPSSQCLGYQGVYAKSWIGESHGAPPNGGGGGSGHAKNITFRNVFMKDIMHPIAVDTTLSYLPDIKGQPHIKPSKFQWSDIHFENFTGTATGNRIVWIDCPKANPCTEFTFKDLNITPGKEDHPEVGYVCNNIVLDFTDGLDQCHPNNSTVEADNDGTM